MSVRFFGGDSRIYMQCLIIYERLDSFVMARLQSKLLEKQELKNKLEKDIKIAPLGSPKTIQIDPNIIKTMHRNASDPKISLDKLPFSEMFLIRDEFLNSDESDTQQFVERSSSEEGDRNVKGNGTIVEVDESRSSNYKGSQ